MQAQLAKIRSDAAECALLSTIAPDNRSSMFSKMAEHLNELASELEKTQAANPSKVVQVDIIQAELIPVSPRDDTDVPEVVVASVQQDDRAQVDRIPQQAERPRRLWWLMALLGTVAGSSFWAGQHPEHLARYLPSSFHDHLKNKPELGPQDGVGAIAALMATEQKEREALYYRLSALDARIEGFAGELEKLRNSQALAISSEDKALSRNGRRRHRGDQPE